MSHEEDQRSNGEDEAFHERVVRYQENSLSEEELIRFNGELKSNPERQAEFIRLCETTRLIREAIALSSEGQVPESAKVLSFPRKLARLEHAGIAALLMLCLVMGWRLLGGGQDSDQPGTIEFGSVAKLGEVSGDAVFHADHELPTEPGSFLGKGWVMLEQGTVEIRFHCGAEVALTGPAEFGIDSALRGFLHFGDVDVYAPEEASGFVIGTANSEVVDLGTRFQLSVGEDAEAELSVTEGLVELHLGGEGIDRQIESLPAGLAARIGRSGDLLGVSGEALDPRAGQEFGLLGHWTLDELPEGLVVADASGHDRHAVFQGASNGAAIAGKSGGALDLQGGGYLDISEHIPALTRGRTFTFAAWVRDPYSIMFSFSNGTPRSRVQFEAYRTSLLYGWQQGPFFDSVQGKVGNWEDGQWHHVAVMVSGREVTLYLDGRHLVSQSVGRRLSSPTLAPFDLKESTEAYIGFLPSNHAHQPQQLGGQIDDVQFYGRALDERAIRYLFENPGETLTNP